MFWAGGDWGLGRHSWLASGAAGWNGGHCNLWNGLSVARIEVLLFPAASVMRPVDPTPSLQPYYEPSSLIRVGPPQCSASVRSPRSFGRLGFSLTPLNIRATGSCSSTRQPASASRPLYAVVPAAPRTNLTSSGQAMC